MNYVVINSDEYLAHHGILGQKWGIRRYQNPDGSLTELGKKRYLGSDGYLTSRGAKKINVRDYNVNARLSRVKKKNEKKYNLTEKQKEYMDEKGNLTLKGGKATLPIGYDLGRKVYQEKAKKELKNYSESWNAYLNAVNSEDKELQKETEEIFHRNANILYNTLDEIDVEEGRKYILRNIK